MAKHMAEGWGGGYGACRECFWVVNRGSPATDAFIVCHEDLPNKELYSTKRMVHIT